MVEEWRDILGYENRYQISNLGRVKSTIRGNSRILARKYCSKGKYIQICLSIRNEQKYFLVHRLVAIAYIPEGNHALEVNHLDGNTHNNELNNLEWCTRAENILHSFNSNGRKPTVLTRDQCALTKLKSDKIPSLVEMKLSGFTNKQIAAHFGMSESGIEKVIQKHKHLLQ